MNKAYPELSQLLRQIRKKVGYSQAEVAQKLGLTRSAYTYYETGRILPNIMVLRDLSILFGVPAEAFLFPEKYLENRDTKPVR